MRTLLVLLCLSLTACAGSDPQTSFRDRLRGVEDKGSLTGQLAETTPVIWNGQLIYVLAARLNSAGTELRVLDERGNVLGVGPANFGLVSALVENGRLYVWGVTDWGTRNDIRLTSTVDFVTWEVPVVVKTAKVGQTIFNTSVAKDANGYVLAYEVCETALPCFSFRFARSTDMVNWTDVGDRFAVAYSACPTIRYLDGMYYVFYLVIAAGKHVTAAAKSRDLKVWEGSSLAVITPEHMDPASTNASDLDFVERNGVLEMVWINGDQVTWGHTRRARYQGTFAEFVAALF